MTFFFFLVGQTITFDSIRARLEILLLAPHNNWVLGDLYLTCNFPLMTTSKLKGLYFCLIIDHLIDFKFSLEDCYPNGTMTALAVKVESVPNLIPSSLTLKDKSCKPVFSNDRVAYFSFSVNSCGTIRTVSLLSHLTIEN